MGWEIEKQSYNHKESDNFEQKIFLFLQCQEFLRNYYNMVSNGKRRFLQDKKVAEISVNTLLSTILGIVYQYLMFQE